MTNRQTGIYKILNKANGKIYVGSAADFYERWHSHKHYLNSNNHHNDHLQRAWNKYGEINFEFIVLETVEDRSKVVEREQYWLDETKCFDPEIGYNIKVTANSNLGLKYSDETRAKMSAWQIGNWLSEETKQKISDANRGKKLPLSTRLKMRKLDKWPCPDGSLCRCDKCKAQRRDLHFQWTHS